jgi:hypothetical protein
VKFQSKYVNACYVFQSGGAQIDPRTNMPIGPPRQAIRAKFRGPQRLFDSEGAALEFGWSKETREAVEAFLLTHRDFGSPGHAGQGGLYLAPGEVIPKVHAKLKIKVSSDTVQAEAIANPTPKVAERCAFFATGTDNVEQCEAEAVTDGLCATHAAEAAKAVA